MEGLLFMQNSSLLVMFQEGENRSGSQYLQYNPVYLPSGTRVSFLKYDREQITGGGFFAQKASPFLASTLPKRTL